MGQLLRSLLWLPLVLCSVLPAYAEPGAARDKFRVLDTAHFHFSYNTGEVFARKRAELFETLYTELTKFFTGKGLPTTAPRQRMNVLLLATRREFEAHTRGVTLPVPHADGYYSMKERRSVFFNALEDPGYAADTEEITARERDLQRRRAQLAMIPTNEVIVYYGSGQRRMTKAEAFSVLAAEALQVQKQRARLLGNYDRGNESTTLHECAHQLIHNLGIVPMADGSPRWLDEGLATFFEAALAGDLDKPPTVNYARLVEYRTADRGRRLVSLEKLITDDRNVVGNSAFVGYPESWALVHYVFHEQPERMKRYLERLKTHGASAGGSGAQRRLADFRQAFGGDLAAFEASWIAYMAGIR